MYGKLENFNKAFDDLSIEGRIFYVEMEKILREKCGYKNADNMLTGCKAEVNMKMGDTLNLNLTTFQNQSAFKASNTY